MSLWDLFESLRELISNFQAGTFSELGIWSYFLLALLVATEGPLSTLVGATAAAAGLLDWRWVLAATVLGNIVGDCIWYSVGYMGRVQWLYDHGRWLGLRPHQVARLEREMRLHATKLIIFAKIAYGLIVPTLVAAGIARVPWRKWFPVVFVVETLWSILLVWVGFHTTALIQDFEHALHTIGVAILAGGAMFLIMRTLRKRIDLHTLELDPLTKIVAEESAIVLPPDEITPKVVVVREKVNVGAKASLRCEGQSESEGQSELLRFIALPEYASLHYGSEFGGVGRFDEPVAGRASRGWSARRTRRRTR